MLTSKCKRAFMNSASAAFKIACFSAFDVRQILVIIRILPCTHAQAMLCFRFQIKPRHRAIVCAPMKHRPNSETSDKTDCFDLYLSFVLRDIWFVSSTGQTCPEGRSTNRTRGPMRGAPPYPTLSISSNN